MEAIISQIALKINLPGGIISPGQLKSICKIFLSYDIDHISIGSRQELIANFKPKMKREYLLSRLQEELNNLHIPFEINKDLYPNIVSSYCAEDVFATNPWLSEETYKDILDKINFHPKIKINISDSEQSFTPFFSGHVNFISSTVPDYWYLYLRGKQSNEVARHNLLIYTDDIGKVCQFMDEAYQNNITDLDALRLSLANTKDIIQKTFESKLALPPFRLPYYEGFNRYGEKTWLGIYRRKEKFKTEFLSDLCDLCLESKMGQICSTPWKSIIIKGIENKYRSQWDDLLGKHGLNIRHAANELNWQLEDNNEESKELKQYILREFDDLDVRTFGLCFAIQTKPKSEVFGSIIIKENKKFFNLLKSYSIYQTLDFNPNSRHFRLYKDEVSKANLPGELYQLTKQYYKKRNATTKPTSTMPVQKVKPKSIFECKLCMTWYDAEFGDFTQGIEAGVPFEALPPTYYCPTCESDKTAFVKVDN
jgi:rubredoxin